MSSSLIPNAVKSLVPWKSEREGEREIIRSAKGDRMWSSPVEMDVPVGGHLKSIALEFSLPLCSGAPLCYSRPRFFFIQPLHLPILEAYDVVAPWCRDAIWWWYCDIFIVDASKNIHVRNWHHGVFRHSQKNIRWGYNFVPMGTKHLVPHKVYNFMFCACRGTKVTLWGIISMMAIVP